MNIIIVGAGYAGLFSALRLARLGHTITVLEQNLLGAGPSGKNHGILHSGALYAGLHPEIVPDTLASQTVFAELLAPARVVSKPSLYAASPESMPQRQIAWQRAGIDYWPYPQARLREFLHPRLASKLQAVEIPQETIYSSYELLRLMASYCLDHGVDIRTNCRVESLKMALGTVTGVVLTDGSRLAADRVLLASGLGTHRLVASSSPRYHSVLRSRLDMMIVARQRRPLERSLMVCDFGGITMAPARHGRILISAYGTAQPTITEEGRYEPKPKDIKQALEVIAESVDPTLIDMTDPVTYLCHKTEYAHPDVTDRWGVNPGYSVHNHASEGVHHLYSALPGKMTLAPQVSRLACEMITGQPEPLRIQLDIPSQQYRLRPEANTLMAPPVWMQSELQLGGSSQEVSNTRDNLISLR